MRRIARIAVGLAMVMALAYSWLPVTQGHWIPLSMMIMGLTGGLIMGSRWSIALIPAAIMAAGWLWQRIECADCPQGTDPTFGILLMYLTAMLGLAALSAWAGCAGSRWVAHSGFLDRKPSIRQPGDRD